jgi:hypothetical protein
MLTAKDIFPRPRRWAILSASQVAVGNALLPFKHGTSRHFQNYQHRSLQSWQEGTKTKKEAQHGINQISSTFDGMCSVQKADDRSHAG